MGPPPQRICRRAHTELWSRPPGSPYRDGGSYLVFERSETEPTSSRPGGGGGGGGGGPPGGGPGGGGGGARGGGAGPPR
ncbi:hypothetical protein, partial [Nocardia cyriacigeorgica]|uniref:hypothetical protein n=1 Tax=Nocardia cyriacigeorgica TaxID=135487 RepID=UPI00245495EA